MRKLIVVFTFLSLCATIAGAAWYRDRDNSMVPLASTHPRHDAFVTVATSHGVLQGVQVCPNVFLTAGHVVADALAANLDRPGTWIKMIQYPMSDVSFLEVEQGNFQVTTSFAENLRGPSRSQRDYSLFAINAPLPPHPQTFVRPLGFATDVDLIAASSSGLIDIHSMRPATRFNLTSQGEPDFDVGSWASGLSDIMPLYNAPMHTDQRCEIVSFESDDTLAHSCSAEASVSGSSLVVEVNGELFLAAMTIQGRSTVDEAFQPVALPNNSVQSRHFCADYEAVCGEPCAELSELTDPPESGANFLDTRLTRITEACENGWGACQTSAYSLALEARHGTAQMPRDPVQALELLRMAAENGSAPAHLDLALLHEVPIADAEIRAREVWEGIREARQRTVPDIRALFDLAAPVTPDPAIAADHHIAALEGGLNTMLYRTADDWPEATARAVQQRLAERGLLTGPVDGRIGPGTQRAMEALCQCGT